MKHPFSDSRPFRRDPLGFLLAKSEADSSALVPLALGLNRAFLVNDVDLLTLIVETPEELIEKGRLAKIFGPIAAARSKAGMDEALRRRRPLSRQTLARATVEQLVPQLLCDIRRAVFQLMRQSSFDAQSFGAGLSMKLTCTALFGSQTMTDLDELRLKMLADKIFDEAKNDVFRAANMFLSNSNRRNMRVSSIMEDALSEIIYKSNKCSDESIFSMLARTNNSSNYIISILVRVLLYIYMMTSSIYGWILYIIATNKIAKEMLEEEADACLLSNKEIDISRIASTNIAYRICLESLRLFASPFLQLFLVKKDCGNHAFWMRSGDRLIISPWIFHRSSAYWSAPGLFDMSRNYESKAYMRHDFGSPGMIGSNLAMLQLQLVLIDIAAAFEFDVAETPPNLPLRPLPNLVSPPIKLKLKVRRDYQLYPRAFSST